MPITLDGTNGITTPTYGGADTSEYLVPVTQFKNRIINGAMVIDQRNAGASVTPTATTYTLDRWNIGVTQASKLSVQQNAGSVTPPAGFRNYLGVTSLSAYSVLSSDFFCVIQAIEGFNTADLNFGTANAQTTTLSFWVRSSLTGTFGGSLSNSDGTRSYSFTYTISSANTWEQKSLTFVGDSSGTWLTNNSVGLYVIFGLGAGSTYSGTAGSWVTPATRPFSATGATSVVGTNGATFYITGVQLEVGSTATSFDYRPYGTELALCQRYCWKYGGTNASQYLNGPGLYADGNTIIFGSIPHPVSMRTSASLTVVGSPRVSNNGAPSTGWTPTISGPGGLLNAWIDMTKTSHGITAGVTTNIQCNTTNDYFLFTAEL